jgi:hypothetical protein
MPTGDRPGAPEPDPHGPATRALPTLATRLQAARVAAWRDPRVLRFLVLWVLASPLAALLVYALLFPAEHRLDLLARRGVDTTGVVSRVDGGDVRFRFRAENAEQSGQDTPRAPNPPVAELKPGDRLAVSYDPQDVGRSCACDPALLERPPTGWAYLTWFAIGFAGVAAYIYQRELRRLARYLARRSRELRSRRVITPRSNRDAAGPGPSRPEPIDPGPAPGPRPGRAASREDHR